MVNRRQILQGGIAVTSLPIVSQVAWGATPEPQTPLLLYKVVYDERFAESRTFGDEARRLGAPVHAIQGDVTSLWYDDLCVRWRNGAAAIAGLTAHGALFCLERLAWDAGMRVVFRADHKPTVDGSFHHSLQGPMQMVRAASSLRDAGTDWSCRIANVVIGCPADVSNKKQRAVYAATSAATGEDGEALTSWVIAPVRPS
jgi:hypothetical protein